MHNRRVAQQLPLSRAVTAASATNSAAASRDTRHRLLFIDGLRGIAATSVVIYHFVGRTEWGVVRAVTDFGYLGVAVFFVISGYVITLTVANHRVSAGFLARFALRRAIRLDPPYWASLILATLLPALASIALHTTHSMPSAAQLFAHVFYLQNLTGHGDLVPIYWTLCLEVQFYLALTLMLWILQRISRVHTVHDALARPASQLLLLSLGFVSLFELTDLIDVVPAGTFVPYWFCFTIGSMLFWLHRNWLSMWLVATLAVSGLIFGLITANPWPVTASLLAGLLHVAHTRHRMDRWLTNRPTQFLGRISYSLYLFHAIVGWSAMSLALRFFPDSLAIIVGVATSLIAGWFGFHVLERPSIAWSRRIAPTTARHIRPSAIQASSHATAQKLSPEPAPGRSPSESLALTPHVSDFPGRPFTLRY